jgi:hypothetical protein
VAFFFSEKPKISSNFIFIQSRVPSAAAYGQAELVQRREQNKKTLICVRVLILEDFSGSGLICIRGREHSGSLLNFQLRREIRDIIFQKAFFSASLRLSAIR